MVKELASNRTKVEVAVGGIVTSLLAILAASIIQGEFDTLEIVVPLIFGFILVWFGIQGLAILEFFLVKTDMRKDIDARTTELVRKLDAEGSKEKQPPPTEEGPTWK